MAAEKDAYKREMRRVTIKTTDGATFTGEVNLGIKDRVSDLFTKETTPFIVLTDAETREGSGKIFIINKSQIVWAEPHD